MEEAAKGGSENRQPRLCRSSVRSPGPAAGDAWGGGGKGEKAPLVGGNRLGRGGELSPGGPGCRPRSPPELPPGVCGGPGGFAGGSGGSRRGELCGEGGRLGGGGRPARSSPLRDSGSGEIARAKAGAGPASGQDGECGAGGGRGTRTGDRAAGVYGSVHARGVHRARKRKTSPDVEPMCAHTHLIRARTCSY